MSWLDDLEARLETELDGFLRTNPDQEALLAEQERRDRQEALRRQRLQLQESAERARADLLQLASDIRCWQERVAKARHAGAEDLARRAEAHVGGLMEQGRQRWQALAELGQRFGAVEWELSQLGRQATGTATQTGASTPASAPTAEAGSDLGEAWAAFEAQQELEALKQRLKR
jgi:hercynine metabolism protein